MRAAFFGLVLQQHAHRHFEIAGLALGVMADIGVEIAVGDIVAGRGLSAAALADQMHLAGFAGFLDRRGGADVLAVPEANDAAKVFILLQDGAGDVMGLGGVPVGRLRGDDFQFRMLGQTGDRFRL